MEYLRRYILNGYASLGVNRRDIPTTSYFYKILGVTNTEDFYKNLWIILKWIGNTKLISVIGCLVNEYLLKFNNYF